MAVTLSPQTEALLRDQAHRLGQSPDLLADALLLGALQSARDDFEETCQAIAEGLADADAGRVTSLEAARADWERRNAAQQGSSDNSHRP